MLFSIQIKRKLQLFATAIALVYWCLPSYAAENISLSVKPGYEFVDVDGADFGGSLALEGVAGLKLNQSFAVEAGLYGLYESQTDKECDNTGCYRLSVSSFEAFFGGRYDVLPGKRFSPYARAGLLFYSLEVELEEEFYGIKPEGSDSADDTGMGLYISAGTSLRINDMFALFAEIQYRSRKDVFENSSAPFDVNSLGVGAGFRWSF